MTTKKYTIREQFIMNLYKILNFFLMLKFKFKYKFNYLKSVNAIESNRDYSELLFIDDFHHFNKQLWRIDYPWDNVNYRMENLSIDDSILKIQSRHEETEGYSGSDIFGNRLLWKFDYTSGMIYSTSPIVKYGQFDIKVKLHNTFGTNQAFWLLNLDTKDVIWEIDIFEYINGKKYSMTNHWGSGYSGNKHKQDCDIVNVDLSKDYYICSVRWTKDYIKWYINDELLKIQTLGIPNVPMYVTFSDGTWCGGDPNNSSCVNVLDFPSEVLIDYIKIYSIEQ